MQVVNPEQGILQVYKNLCRAVIDLIKKHLKSPCLIRGSAEDRDRCLCSSHPACDSLGAVGESRLWMRAEVWRAISSCQIVLGSEALRLQQDSTRHSRNPVFCCRLQNIFRATWPFVGSASWCLLLRASCFSILDDIPPQSAFLGSAALASTNMQVDLTSKGRASCNYNTAGTQIEYTAPQQFEL